MSIMPLIANLKNTNQDFEFYPTTQEIIDIIKKSIISEDNNNFDNKDEIYKSILDCGAGNGTALNALTKGTKYAIEKSEFLILEMPPNIFIVGCDFFHNTLIDKKVDIVFCNPPYSQYKEWALKIINEANAADIFLVLPERWKIQENLISAIKDRDATFKIIGNTDFLDADRKSRAKVDIIRIYLQSEKRYYNHTSDPQVDPFKLWVSKEFPIKTKKEDYNSESDKKTFQKKINELVPGRGLVPVLVELYENELTILQNNFRSISQLDQSLFEELKVDFASITKFLRNRITGLKSKYWNELFNKLDPITSRLTTASRKSLLSVLTDNISVDFNESNIYAVTTWAIKNANNYFDSQLIDVFTNLAEKANIIKYKSNQKTWGNDEWRFQEEMREGKIQHFGLDYRCVITCYHTFSSSGYDRYDYPNGLNQTVHDKLNNIVVIAHNLGFICPSWENSLQKLWAPGLTNDFVVNKDTNEILMSVKAYKNGNLHIKFNQKFLRKLNVEFGRLKGWLRNHKEASEELNIPEKEAKLYFNTNFVLECSGVKLLSM